MPQDILNPKDEGEVSADREVKPLRGMEPPQTTPTIGAPEPPMSSPPAPPMSGTLGATEGVQAQPQADPMMEAILSPPRLPDTKGIIQLSGEDVSVANDPLEEIDAKIRAQTQQLDPAVMVQNLAKVSYTPQYQTSWDDDWETDQDRVERAIGDIRIKNFKIQQANQYGFNPNNIGRNGMPNAPALDTDVQSRGLSSEMSKAMEDKLNELFWLEKIPVIGDAVKGMRDVQRSIVGLGLFALQSIPGVREHLDKGAKSLGLEKPLEALRLDEQHLMNQVEPTKFDPSKGQFGDYGTGGTGAALYALNLVPSVAVGSIYNMTDFVKWAASGGKEDPYEGSRAWDAIVKGRDWGLSNRWSDEKYLGVQEPEGLKPGQLTGNLWWDLPENIHKGTGGKIGLRAAHWMTQGTAAIASELLIDLPFDKIWDDAIKAAKRSTESAQIVSRQTEELVEQGKKLTKEVNPPEVTPPPDVETPKVDPMTGEPIPETAPPRISRNEAARGLRTLSEQSRNAPKIEMPNVWTPDLIRTKPDEAIKIATNPKIKLTAWENVIFGYGLDNSVYTVTRRSDGELAFLSKLIPDPWDNSKPLVNSIDVPVLSENELRAIEMIEPLAMGRYGSPVLPGTGIQTKALPPSTMEYFRLMGQLKPQNIDAIMTKRAGQFIDLAKAAQRDSTDVSKYFTNLKQTEAELLVTKARLLDEGRLYNTIKSQLPESLQTKVPLQEADGEVMLQTQFNLDNLIVRKHTIEAQIHELNEKINDIDQQVSIVGDIGRQDIEESLRTREWSGGNVPEYDLASPTPTLDTEMDYEVVDVTQYPEVSSYREPNVINNIPDDVRDVEVPSEVSPDGDSGTYIPPDDDIEINDVLSIEEGSQRSTYNQADLKALHSQEFDFLGQQAKKQRRILTLDELNELPPDQQDEYMTWMDSLTDEEFGALEKRQRLLDSEEASGSQPVTDIEVELNDALSVELGSQRKAQNQADLNALRSQEFDFLGQQARKYAEQGLVDDTTKIGVELKPDEVQPVGRQQGSFDTTPVATGFNKKTVISDKYLTTLPENIWKHGTRLPDNVLLNKIDPVLGGSPSEFGLGVYLTRDDDVATAAALKFDTINKPPVLDVPKGLPHIQTVNTGRLKNVLNLNAPIPRGGIRTMLQQAATYATKNQQFAEGLLDGVQEFGGVWNAFRKKYYQFFGTPASEGVVRNFQQYVTQSFRNLGIDAGYYNKNGVETLVVYSNNKLGISDYKENIYFPDSMEVALKAQAELDNSTLIQMMDDVSKANYLNSNRELAEYFLHQHGKNLAEVQGEMLDNLDATLDAEVRLARDIEETKLKALNDAEQNLPDRTVNDYTIKSLDDSPCPPMPPKFMKGLK